ncbi:MAG: glycosyltransferase family 2 protein, partial [Thermomicrobiales bacterium]
MAAALARAVIAFHAVKLAGVAVNLVLFPTLRPEAAGSVSAHAGAPRRWPPAAPTRPGRAPRPVTSVLVPARDEAHRLPATLAGLLAQDVTEIIVLDDQSRDATAAVARRAEQTDPRVRFARGTPPPPGWTGKNWACQQLAAAARGDLLVFCDADVLLAPGALDAGGGGGGGPPPPAGGWGLRPPPPPPP